MVIKKTPCPTVDHINSSYAACKPLFVPETLCNKHEHRRKSQQINTGIDFKILRFQIRHERIFKRVHNAGNRIQNAAAISIHVFRINGTIIQICKFYEIMQASGCRIKYDQYCKRSCTYKNQFPKLYNQCFKKL